MHGKDKRRHDLHADAAGLAVHLTIEGRGAFLPPNTLETRQNLNLARGNLSKMLIRYRC
jgi:hypothetical protein